MPYASKVKRAVPWAHHSDGKPFSKGVHNKRTVYTRQDGTEYVNHNGGTSDLVNGVYITHSYSVRAESFDDVIDRIKGVMHGK